MFWAKSCTLGRGGGCGVVKCFVTHNLDFKERVLNVHPYLVYHICTTQTEIYRCRGEVYLILKDSIVNTNLMVNRSQKILTGQDINLTFTS